MWGSTDDDRLARALGYPFDIPDNSFVYEDGQTRAFENPGERDGRIPVIACGSNRAPKQLAWKYRGQRKTKIPVERAWLADFDVVHVAHLTSYGSIAAALQHVEAMRVEVSINWLTEDQLALMHETESIGEHYHYAQLNKIALDGEVGGRLDSAFTYTTILGCLSVAGKLAGLAAVRAEQRPHATMTQPEIQSHVRGRLGREADDRAFILGTIGDGDLRRARTSELARDAHPFAWPHLEVGDSS
ncbi:MAG: hypothetical protein ACTSUD_02935 [Alphaproteobacteria bacterium]